MIDNICIRALTFKKPILLVGETGSGKSFYAKKLHQKCFGDIKKFRQINISSLTKNLFESELFGHTRGSFTGAISYRSGALEAIGEGTLYIDEIDSLELDLQSKLLSILEEGIFTPIGSNDVHKFRGQFIFSSQRDLFQMVENGEFRKDLYYRLSSIEQRIPSLRDSISPSKITCEFQKAQGVFNTFIKVESDVIDKMLEYDWPGNFRELKSCIDFLILASRSNRICLQDFSTWLGRNGRLECAKSTNVFRDKVENYEKEIISDALRLNFGKINQTSRYLSLNKTTLIAKIRKYDIKTEPKFLLA